MRILFLYQSFPEFFQPYMEDLAFRLSSQPEVDLEILSISDRNLKYLRYNFPKITYLEREGFLKYLGFYLNKIKGIFLSNYKPYSLLEYTILKGNYDVIHVQQSFLIRNIFKILKRNSNFKLKIVISFRGGDTYIKPWIDEKWREYYLKGIAENNCICQVMSENQKQYLSRWGIPLENIYVIPTSVNKVVFFPAPEKKLGKVINICSTFRFRWEKNIEQNLRVILALKERGIFLKYYVFGGGQDIGQLFYWIDRLKLNDQVIYRGKQRPEVLSEEYRNMDFILQMSASESLGTSVLEAEACGVPAIVSDSGGIPETIIHGKTGFCIPYGDVELAAEKILYLYNEHTYNRFRSKCIEFIKNEFSTEIEIGKILNMYTHILYNN